MNVHRIGWIILAVAAFGLPAVTANTYYLYVGASVGLLTIVTAGLNILAGFTGQISLGHAGFFAIGAYAASILTVRAGWSPWTATLVAIAAAALVGVVVAGAALRVSGPYLAMVTIAFGIIVEGILVEWVALTGGPGGIFNIPKPTLSRSYLLITATAAVALWLVANLHRSPWGRAFLAIRASEVAAESLGLSSYFVRIAAFTLSAGFAGAAGALFAFLNGYISPDSFTLQSSILYLLALLFGGTVIEPRFDFMSLANGLAGGFGGLAGTGGGAGRSSVGASLGGGLGGGGFGRGGFGGGQNNGLGGLSNGFGQGAGGGLGRSGRRGGLGFGG